MASSAPQRSSAAADAARAAREFIISDSLSQSSHASMFFTSDGLSALTGVILKEMVRAERPHKRPRQG
eukprot:2142015-Rhodomonas_salina.1